MREIKFRGFCEHENGKIVISVNSEKRKGEWVYGDLITYGNETVSIRQPKTWFRQNIIPKTVGQFTGLKDRNGKGIYEGDILTFKPPNHKVNVIAKVEYVITNFRVVNANRMSALLSDASFFSPKIIGNIYENPELLEENNENNNN